MPEEEYSEEERKVFEEKIKRMSPEELKEFQKRNCVFCSIVLGHIPAKKVYEDNHCLAVLEINPAAPGHILLLPKEHHAIMPQIPEEEIGHLFMAAKHLSHALLRGLKCGGVNLFVANGAVAGQKFQHFVIHIIPRKEGDGIKLELPQREIPEDILSKINEVVQNRFNELMGIKKEVVKVETKEHAEKKKEAADEEESEKRKEETEKTDPPEEENEDENSEKSEEENDASISLDDIASVLRGGR
ncbi:MAG TPA: HIT domain-containing protein [Candidatus Nanoarchaeia archaeon]|nr:HIT domain-containing protein [Candidatus Nanoarchaeia archaeon]